jgi:hypothetical protein
VTGCAGIGALIPDDVIARLENQEPIQIGIIKRPGFDGHVEGLTPFGPGYEKAKTLTVR